MIGTDFVITGGKAAFDNPTYWLALIPALIMRFVTPLPYNYYKLKKFILHAISSNVSAVDR